MRFCRRETCVPRCGIEMPRKNAASIRAKAPHGSRRTQSRQAGGRPRPRATPTSATRHTPVELQQAFGCPNTHRQTIRPWSHYPFPWRREMLPCHHATRGCGGSEGCGKPTSSQHARQRWRPSYSQTKEMRSTISCFWAMRTWVTLTLTQQSAECDTTPPCWHAP